MLKMKRHHATIFFAFLVAISVVFLILAPNFDVKAPSGRLQSLSSLKNDCQNAMGGHCIVNRDTPVDGMADVTSNTSKNPRRNYFTDVQDPAAEKYFEEVIQQIPGHMMFTFANITGATYTAPNIRKKRCGIKWPANVVSAQKKWRMLVEVMWKFGYTQRLPTVINIGVKKSGTTGLLFYLSKHPQIAPAIDPESHYFTFHYHSKSMEYYRSTMGFSTNGMLTLEKSPSYMSYIYFKEAPERVRRHLPGKVKFILCVRDPLERLISDFRHEYERYHNAEVSKKRETPASQAKQFVKTIFNSSGQPDLTKEIVDMSLYSNQFKNWLKSFPLDRFYILDHERFNKNIFRELKNIEKFLGLKPFYEKDMFYYDKEKRAPCMYVGCPPYATLGLVTKAKLKPGVVKKLRDYFRPFNQEFERLTKMNFSWTNL